MERTHFPAITTLGKGSRAGDDGSTQIDPVCTVLEAMSAPA
jgi:hypothetical protein